MGGGFSNGCFVSGVRSIAAVKDVSEGNKICVLDIDVQGVKAVKQAPPSVLDPHYLFISAPSMEVLEARLRGRCASFCLVALVYFRESILLYRCLTAEKQGLESSHKALSVKPRAAYVVG